MKEKKSKLLAAIVTFLFLLVMVPAAKVEAATAPVPKNLKPWNQKGSILQVAWSLDSSLKNKTKGKDYGYQLYFIDLKGNVITKATESSVKVSKGVCVASVKSSKFISKPVKINVRTYIVSNGKKVWSKYATKYVIPRARITGGTVVGTSTKAKLYWNSVEGATSYTLYLSSDNGATFSKVGTTRGTVGSTSSLQMNKLYIAYVRANNVKVGSKRYNSTYLKYSSSKIANTFAFRIVPQ